MTRAATSPELAKYRGDEQWSRLYLAIQPATVIYTARVNQTFTTRDRLVQLTYDGGSGTLANVLTGMTMWIGSSAGAYDIGIARIRKTPSATKFFIGETSELVSVDDNDYITVVNTFGPWQRNLVTQGSSVKMDYDLEFPSTTGGYAPPVPIMGPIAAVIRRTAATVDFHPPSSATSYSQISSIASVLHAFPGASATSGLATNTPTATYNADGCYRRDLTVTDANGRSTMGHRVVFVNPTSPGFTLLSNSGDFEGGDWSFEVECYSGVDISTIYDMAMVVLWARDRYGQTEGSIGPVAEHENILCVGWIQGETIEWDAKMSKVRFTVRGPQYWLDMEDSYPTGLVENASPSSWTQFPTLTVDDMLFHLLMWRSTLCTIMDCFLTGDTKRMRKINLPYGSLWSQIKGMCYDTIWAYPNVNYLGQLYIQIDLNLLPVASRSSIPVVQLITKADCIGKINLRRNKHSRERNFVEVSGVSSWNGTVASPLWSRAPGNVPARFGKPEAPSYHLFTNQADANRISGAIYARDNCPYELDVKLTNQRLIDICPHQYLTHTMVSGDTIRGITMTTQNFIPRTIERSHNPKSGLLTTTVHCIQETIGVDGVTYVPLQGGTPSQPPVLPPTTGVPPILPGGGLIPPPVIVPPPGDTGSCSGADLDNPSGTFHLVWDRTHLDAGTGVETDRHAYAWFPMSIRPSSALVPTTFYMSWNGFDFSNNQDVLRTHLHVYAIDAAKNRLLEGGMGGSIYSWTFSPVSSLPIAGFEAYLDGDGDTDFTGWVKGAFIAVKGPSAGVPDGFGGLVVGQYYCVEYQTGWWEPAFFVPRHIHTDIEFLYDGQPVGHIGYKYEDNTMHLDCVYPIVHAEEFTPGRWIYFFHYPGGVTMGQQIFGNPPGAYDNPSGPVLTTLNNASVTGARYVDLGETYVENPCATS